MTEGRRRGARLGTGTGPGYTGASDDEKSRTRLFVKRCLFINGHPHAALRGHGTRNRRAGSGSRFQHRIERALIVGHVFLSRRVRYPLAIDDELVLVLSRRDGDCGFPTPIFMPTHWG